MEQERYFSEEEIKLRISETELEVLIWGLQSLVAELEKAGEVLTGDLQNECYVRKRRAEELANYIRSERLLPF